MNNTKDLRGFGNLAGLVVITLMALYAVTFSAISIRQHDALLTHKEDLGQIDQAVWNSLHGRWLVETDDDHQSTRLTDHVEPSLVAASLVFLLWDDVRALLVLQALVAALGAWAVFLLAREVLAHDGRPRTEDGGLPSAVFGLPSHWFGVAFALVYLLFPALEAAHLAEFHAAPLAAAPLAFALLFLERRQWRRFFVASLLVIAVKEEMALVGVMLGAGGVVVAILDGRRPTTDGRASSVLRPPSSVALSAMLLSLAWFILATFVIIPSFGAAKYATTDSIYFQRFGELGNTPAAVVRTLLTNPMLVFRVLSAPERLGYLGGLLASVGFVALAAPWALLIGAPLLAANLLSNYPAQYSGDFHYSASLVPVFVAAAVYGTKRITHHAFRITHFPFRLNRPHIMTALLIVMLLCAFSYHRARGYSPLAENFYWPPLTPHHEAFARFAAQIPREARLSTTPSLFPHLSHREVIYLFPVVADADYVLLDASGVTDMHPNDLRRAVTDLQQGGQFGVADSADGYVLFRRGLANPELSDAFYAFARAPNAQPQYRTDVVFGDALELIGYDVVPDARWHRVSTRLYWQALGPLDNDLRLYPFYHDAGGRIIEDTTQRPMIATVWYPPSSWRMGEIIQTETLSWDVGDHFALAVGVMHGNDWDRQGRRLVANNGETQIELGRFAWRGRMLIRAGD